ncbi:MAG: hypothetical protein H7321_09690 [Bacteroidia bacterium]|nr:hypothetical protein [Bacteroidia bacterium]
MRTFKLLLILIAVSLSHAVNAQSGWDYIKKNDFASAKKTFELKLKQDSLDKDALNGMIFTSSTSGDDVSLRKNLDVYTRNYWDDNIYLLFNDDISYIPKKELEKGKFSERIKLDTKLEQAETDEYNRKFEESKKGYESVNGNYKWTYFGPLQNINGSGHIEKFEVETDAYNPGKTYKDESGAELKWVNPAISTGIYGVNPKSVLNSYNSSTYYANIFFKSDKKQTIQIRLKRSEPIRIWLDDNEVYSNNESVQAEYDNEIIEVEIEAGMHRILLKSSDYNTNSGYRLGGYGRIGRIAYGEEGYDYEDYDFDDYGYNSNSSNIIVRLTDKDGKLINFETTDKADYTKHQYTPTVQSFHVIQHFNDEIKKDPSNLFNYFALERAYKKYGLSKMAEPYFVKYLRSHPDFVFAKYLAFDLYLYNGKKETAYGTLNDINQAETPIFDILYEKFTEIDKDNEDEKYFAALSYLHELAPSKFRVINLTIRYYENKDEKEKKDEFINQVIKEYPEYTYRLEDRLEKNLKQKRKERNDEFKTKSKVQYSYKGNIKDTKKHIKKYFSYYDYEELIEHYAGKNEISKSLALYDELIAIKPYRTSNYQHKAELLLEEERYEEAINEVNKAFTISPSDGNLYELLGDIYFEKKDKEKALVNFNIAKHYGMLYRTGGYGLSNKIEKIEGPKQMKKLFKTTSFQDILDKKSDWQEKYKDEESVILMYTNDVVKDADNRVENFSKFMVKILTDAGINKWLEYDFSFMGEVKSARIIKTNGSEVIPEGSGSYKVFSNLEVGDIIQVEGSSSYTIDKSDAESFFSYTTFTFEAPIYYSKYEIAVPENTFLGYIVHKLPGEVQKNNDNGFTHYKWDFNYLPKVANEKNNIDQLDPIANIMISDLQDWSTISKWYERVTYRKLEPTYEVKEILDSIITPTMTQRDKVEAIYNYLTKAIKYSSVPFLQSGHVPKDAGQTLCSRIGDCKDVATVTVSMLREVGIESYYMLVKTNYYFIQKHLPCKYFDHAIAAYVIDGKTEYLDMTTDFYPYFTLPQMDAGAWSLPIKSGTTELVQLPNVNILKDRNYANITINADLNTDRSAVIKANAVNTGLGGGNIRERFASFSEDERKNFILDMMGKGIFDNLTLENYKFENIDSITQPLRSDFNFSAFNFCDRLSGMLIFRVPFMTAVTMKPSLLSQKRFNSLDVTDVIDISTTTQKVNVNFPAGYALLEMPKNIALTSKFGTYNLTFIKTAKGLQVEKTQTFNQSYVNPEDFAAFKEFYLQMLDADSGKIGLKKA